MQTLILGQLRERLMKIAPASHLNNSTTTIVVAVPRTVGFISDVIGRSDSGLVVSTTRRIQQTIGPGPSPKRVVGFAELGWPFS